jgi:SAM-dependent methyltransferase
MAKHDHHEPSSEVDEGAMADLLDLDAEVLHAFLSEVTAWILELTADRMPRRILDLGCGTGTGTFALLERFDPHAGVAGVAGVAGITVIAVDVSAGLLDRLRGKASHLGVASQIDIVQADLDGAWPALDPVDLVWASLSLHHLADPDRVLAGVFATIHPAGLLAVTEMDSFPRFLPDDLGIGRPGLEARLHAALAPNRAEQLPRLGADWGARLSNAGFVVQAERHFAIALMPPLPQSTGRYAELTLQRMRHALADRISADDHATLEVLLDSAGPGAVRRRSDLSVRAERTVWIAQRP